MLTVNFPPLAAERQAKQSQTRKEEGRDQVEGGGSRGGGVDVGKMSADELFAHAFDKAGKAR